MDTLMTLPKHILVLVCLLSGCIACSTLDQSVSSSNLVDPKGNQIIDETSLASNLASLTYAQLMKMSGRFTGTPISISNNPEDVTGYGVLFSTHPLPHNESRNPQVDAPLPNPLWSNESQALLNPTEHCPTGTVRDAYLYLAHILSSDHLSGKRNLSVVALAKQNTQIEWDGILTTSSWSDWRGFKTTRENWIGAQVAEEHLKLNEIILSSKQSKTTHIQENTWVILEHIKADSLVEGTLRVEADQCFTLQVIAHDDPLTELPQHYAKGDVKWPGWYQGGGYGRAAGIYEGNQWFGGGRYGLTQSTGAFGWALFDADQSPSYLMRHGDSASLLFGGYGVIYETQVELTNQTSECVSTQFSFTSYAKLATRSGVAALNDHRTPSVDDLEKTDPSKRPTMIWNGPIYTEYQMRNQSWVDQKKQVILTPTAQKKTGVAEGWHEPLFRWDLKPGETRQSRFFIPVPGYIVAPAALTVETTPCL